MKQKNLYFYTNLLAWGLVLFLIGNYVFGWTTPTATPPSSNLPAPINVGPDPQTKEGNLIVGGNLTTGSFTMATGAGADKVLTTNASGVATWQEAAGGGIPSGAVMFFNLSTCPTGWTALTAAQGRYLVGKPSGGTLAGTAGTALSNLENRPVGQHTHTINDPGHSHTTALNFAGHGGVTYCNSFVGGGASASCPVAVATTKVTSGISLGSAGLVEGTNAPYIQLLVCQKN